MSRTAWQRRAPDVYWKQGDTAPAISERLLDGNGVAVDLTGAAVKFIGYFPGDAAAKINVAASITAPPTSGTVSFTPTAPNTDTIGDMMVEWQVTFGGGAIETFPNSGHQKVRVVDDLAS